MKTITAIIRTKPGTEDIMRDALLAMGQNVLANEPGTLGWFIAQDSKDPCVFTTYERFANDAAMEAHNTSAAVAAFFEIAKPILDGEVILLTYDEVFAKAQA